MLQQITYILLDAARMGSTIDEAKEMNTMHDSLYRGRSEESLAVVAPYLFLFQHKTDFINWYLDNGWGDSWGIMIKSAYPMDELHKHFRKFLIVGTEDNQQLYFRFYDPRVLRIFLPTCDMAQLREFFGPIDYFVMEDEDSAYAIKCWLENGILRSQKLKFDDMLQGWHRPPKPQPKQEEEESDFSMPGQSVPSWQSPVSEPARPSMPSMPSAPSVPSTPSLPSTPSVPSGPSTPSLPSTPSTPSLPSQPSLPSTPSAPSAPSTPSLPSTPSTPSVSRPSIPDPPVTRPSKPKWNMFD